jgi:4-aminobutyrate aminotransferase/(S)-3-amino-2-methylpropionate transaminase
MPDLICLGKGLASGMPISACLGRREVMDAWGASRGASLHTQTFLGHPVGAAAALASLSVVAGLMPQVEARGQLLRQRCAEMGVAVRGAGLLLGLELASPLRASRELLRRGFLALPAGQPAEPGEGVAGGEVLCLTPPLCITEAQLHAFADALEALLQAQRAG